jgi:hypothetical protein
MPSTGAQIRPEPPVEPEVLSFGPKAPTPNRRRTSALVGVVLAVVLAGLAAWRLVPARPADFTAEDLSGVYAGMVRSDGQNEVSTLDRTNTHPSRLTVSPASCTVLFAQTEGNAFPAAAIDGVSTYWLNEGPVSISLFTYRYADTKTAEREYRSLSDALPGCISAGSVMVNRQPVRLRQLATAADRGSPPQLAYVSQSPRDRGRFATQVFQLNNTVTWQYRYDYARGPYDPTASQQLTQSLLAQMKAIQALHS